MQTSGRGPSKAGDPLADLLYAPYLAVLTALLSVLDLFVNRVGPLALHVLADERALFLLRVGPLPRNIAAVTGTMCLGLVLYGFVRMAGWSGLAYRLQVAALAGLLFPAIMIGLFFPKERMPAPVVLIAVGVGHALVALFGIVVLRYDRSAARRASVAASATSALVLTLLVTSSLGAIRRFLETPDSLFAKVTWSLMMGSRLAGELLWCAVPWIALLPQLAAVWRSPRSRGVLGLSVLVALAVAVVAEASLHPNYGIIAYSAFRLSFLSERLAGLYGLFALLAIALSLAALVSEPPEVRQLAAAVLLWIACGFAPRSLSQVLYFVLAAGLIARVTQVTDPEGRRRALLPWGSSLAPPSVPSELLE